MKYTIQEIEEAITNQYIIQDENGDYCIPTKVGDNLIAGIWYKDIALTIPYQIETSHYELYLELNVISKIYKDDIRIISMLFKKIGYD